MVCQQPRLYPPLKTDKSTPPADTHNTLEYQIESFSENPITPNRNHKWVYLVVISVALGVKTNPMKRHLETHDSEQNKATEKHKKKVHTLSALISITLISITFDMCQYFFCVF